MGNPPYKISDHVNDLVALMDYLDLSGALVVGLSVGGLIAQGLYHARPDLARGLILCDTAAKIGSAEMWDERINIARQGGMAALLMPICSDGFRRPFTVIAKLISMASSLCSLERQWMVILAPAWQFATHFRDKASNISVPTICVVGDQDGATPLIWCATPQK